MYHRTIALFLLMRTGMILTKRESVFLLVLYAAMVIWVTLESTGVTSLLSGLLMEG